MTTTIVYDSCPFHDSHMRRDYARSSTLERAEQCLEDAYATGDILDGEHPRIERRDTKTASWSKSKPIYVITTVDWSDSAKL